MAEGRYNDGRRAVTHQVTVVPDGVTISIHDGDGITLARWPLTEMRWLGDERFALGDERLLLADRDLARWLRRLLPRPSRRGLWRGLGIAGAAIAAVVLFFWVGLPLLAGQVARIVPPEWEQASGVWLERQVVRFLAHNRVCVGHEGQRALQATVDRLTRMSTPRLPVTVTVVDSPVVNAFAMPGGRIVVFRGLIAFAEHPNELAGVLAHEMAHSDLRHPTEVAIERAGGAMIVSLLVGDVLGGSAFGMVAQTLVSSAYSRGAERDADARARTVMQVADLTTAPVAAFFDRLAKKEAPVPGFDQATAFLQTHPPTAERAEEMRSSGGAEINPDEWRQLTTICGQTTGYWTPPHGR